MVLRSSGRATRRTTLDAVRADEELEPFYAAMSTDDAHGYWSRKNTESIDGYPTAILAA